MYKHKCSICGKNFERPNKTVTLKIKQHIKNEHGLGFKDYIVLTYFNGSEPECACGCGEKVAFHDKDALWSDNHGFSKYYNCGHVARDPNHSGKSNRQYLKNWSNDDWVKEYYNEMYGIDVLQKTAIDFINGKSANELSNAVKIDVRTLRNAWIKLGLLTESELKSLSQRRKANSALKRRKNFDGKENILPELYNILKTFPQKYTVPSLVRLYNKNNINKIETDSAIILRCLVEEYGKEIKGLILFGEHSKEELEFLDVLFFYFNRKIVKCGYKIFRSENSNKDYYVYDFCINKKLLIEYDGNGYWHKSESAKQRDKEKENFAIELGYKFLRISKKESKNPELILKIKKLAELC